MRRWIEHTGEVELQIDADSEQAVLAEALSGLAELLSESGGARRASAGEEREGEPLGYELSVAAPDRAGLLLAWLEELAWIAERDAVQPFELQQLDLRPDGLKARVLARPVPPRPLVKGITWHRLAFEPRGKAFHARVVLDV